MRRRREEKKRFVPRREKMTREDLRQNKTSKDSNKEEIRPEN